MGARHAARHCATSFDEGNFAGIDSINDCMDKASAMGLTGEQWQEWVQQCVESLCQAGIIDCD